MQGQPYCYKAFGESDGSERKSWDGAVAHCRYQGASLTSILNEEEQTFLRGLIGQTQWLGLDDGWRKRKFYWSDGQTLVSEWAVGEPNNLDYRQHCVVLRGGKLKDWNCEKEQRFTCEKSPDDTGGNVLRFLKCLCLKKMHSPILERIRLERGL